MGEVERELDKFAQDLNAYIGKMDSTIVSSLEGCEKKCLDSSSENVDRYVDCMGKSIKRIEREEAKFQYRLNFTQHKLHDCLMKEKDLGGKHFEQCKKDGLDKVSKYVEELIKTIKN